MARSVCDGICVHRRGVEDAAPYVQTNEPVCSPVRRGGGTPPYGDEKESREALFLSRCPV